MTEAIEALWRALGLETDRVVNDARQQFERDLKAEQAARTQADAATSRTHEHLQAAHTTLANLEKALAERDALRVELDSIRRQIDALTQELHREISEHRTAHEQRVEALIEAHAQARSSLADQRSQLDALQRENTNLTTLNNGLSVGIDNTQSTLASTEAQLLALNAQRTAEQREWKTLQGPLEQVAT